jgi:hypothetical protein
MQPEQIFSIANTLALLSWILLIVVGRKRWVTNLVTGLAVPLLLAILYAALLIQHWTEPPAGGGFGSLAAVALLFSNPWKLLAGWVHYLAFDLFAGTWEVRDAAEKGISHWLVIPSLVTTFMLGPAGLLLYFVTRSVTLRLGRAVTL